MWSAQARLLSELAVFESGFAGDWFFARTGYTGEQGAEIILPNAGAEALWQALLAGGVHPIGLGARDTLRLEAGMTTSQINSFVVRKNSTLRYLS